MLGRERETDNRKHSVSAGRRFVSFSLVPCFQRAKYRDTPPRVQVAKSSHSTLGRSKSLVEAHFVHEYPLDMIAYLCTYEVTQHVTQDEL